MEKPFAGQEHFFIGDFMQTTEMGKTLTEIKAFGDRMITEKHALELENIKLRALVRYQYMTLGFYGTPYNYKEKIGYPDGKWRTGIEFDAGHDARYANRIATELLGYTSGEIMNWGSVFKSLEEAQEFSRKSREVSDAKAC
jgi:hypothetical protein